MVSLLWIKASAACQILCPQLKEGAGDAAGATVKPEVLEQLGEAIFLAEEAYPGISDVMVTQLIQRLQR